MNLKKKISISAVSMENDFTSSADFNGCHKVCFSFNYLGLPVRAISIKIPDKNGAISLQKSVEPSYGEIKKKKKNTLVSKIKECIFRTRLKTK